MESTDRTWRPPQRAVAAFLAILIAAFLFSEAVRWGFFLGFMSFLLAVVLDYPVRLVARVVRRPIAAALVFFAIAGSLGTAIRFAVPVMLDQGTNVVEQAPESLDRFERWWNGVRNTTPVDGVPSGQEIQNDVRSNLRTRLGDLIDAAVPIAGTALAAISSFFLVLVLATFMVASPESYADGMVRLVPVAQEEVAREFLERLVGTMRGWMAAQLISMTVVGVLTAGGLLLLGVNGWLVLGVVNFFCEFVPFIGPVVGAIPGIAVGFAGSTRTGIYAIVLYFAIQQLEGYLINPLAMRQRVHLAPPVLLLWQVVMATAFGVPGILIATPLLACVRVSVDYFWVERSLGKEEEEEQPAH